MVTGELGWGEGGHGRTGTQNIFCPFDFVTWGRTGARARKISFTLLVYGHCGGVWGAHGRKKLIVSFPSLGFWAGGGGMQNKIFAFGHLLD